MKPSKGYIRERTSKNGETVWDIYFSYKGKQFYRTFSEEMEVTECLAELKGASERRDPSVAARLAAECEREKAERQKQATARKEREEKEKQPNFRAPLEFTHKLLLPMSVSYDKMVELVRRLQNADRSQVICATRHITKPPLRVLFLGLRVPRLGSNYVFNVVRGLLGYDITTKIIRIEDKTQDHATRFVEKKSRDSQRIRKQIGENPTELSRDIASTSEILSFLFDKNDQHIRDWNAQGFSAHEIIAFLLPGRSHNELCRCVKVMREHFSSSLRLYVHKSPTRVEILKRWEDVKRWEEEGRSYNWMAREFGFGKGVVPSQLRTIKENQAVNARLQSATHSDE